jgi:hypothetical protein
MKVLPAISVHSWGGFGSQLFALSQCWYLSKKFPSRGVKLVIHTSGVTRRQVEIEPFLSNLSVNVIDDFKKTKFTSGKEYKIYKEIDYLLSFIRRLISNILSQLGFISVLDSIQEYSNIKPWVVSVRGHYTKVPIATEHLSRLKHFFEKSDLVNLEDFHQSITIQYRLGDLLNLNSKSFIKPKTVLDIVSAKMNVLDKSQVNILTDSPKEAMRLLDSNFKGWKVTSFPPIETIHACMNSRFFIGTNSKLSFWIAIFRAIDCKNSLIPITFRENLRCVVGNEILALVDFYED